MSFDQVNAGESFERKKREIRAHVGLAKLVAVPREEFERRAAASNNLAIECEAGHISESEYRERSAALLDMPNVLTFRSLSEFSYALRLLLTEDRVKAVLSHENAHMGRIEHHNLEGYYKIAFVKGEGDEIGIIPLAGFEHPEDMSFEELFRLDEDITSAPDELSEGDKAALEALRSRNKS
ncbi:MAG TPA: hypothetical protein VG102_03005 [Candidatus Paceibacterota bacterium]|nr:hypothetical protein [Candidatus Paceibacterota bacterium]